MTQSLSRRGLIGGIAAAALAPPAFAAKRCLPAVWGVSTCMVSVNVGAMQTAEQQCDDWCWAASIQNIFRLYGHPILQTTVAGRLFPDGKCRQANTAQIMATIGSAPWLDLNGRSFSARSRILPDAQLAEQLAASANANDAGYIQKLWDTTGAARGIINELEAGRPLINLALGHATVLYAATYQRDELFEFSPVGLTRISVLDPWRDTVGPRDLARREAADAFGVLAIEVT